MFQSLIQNYTDKTITKQQSYCHIPMQIPLTGDSWCPVWIQHLLAIYHNVLIITYYSELQ